MTRQNPPSLNRAVRSDLESVIQHAQPTEAAG